jgi:hypothetical protein
MAERSFQKEVQSLTLGQGQVFHGEGILAVTKALLQSGVAYVGGIRAHPSRLVRGYGETHRRGRANYERIVAELIDPALRGEFAPSFAADAIASARAAALKDPEGDGLANTLDEIRTRKIAKVA